jgi:hypothetical protein
MKRFLFCWLVGLVLLGLSLSARLTQPEAAAASEVASALRAERQPARTEAAALKRGALLYHSNQYEQAEDRFREAVQPGDPLSQARADYDRGNCLVNRACKEGDHPDTTLLNRAVDLYRSCLNGEKSTVDGGSLFDDARHNLELTKSLLQKDCCPDASSPDPFNPPNEQSATEAKTTTPEPSGDQCPDAEDDDDLCPECQKKLAEMRAAQQGKQGKGEPASAGDAKGDKGSSQQVATKDQTGNSSGSDQPQKSTGCPNKTKSGKS